MTSLTSQQSGTQRLDVCLRRILHLIPDAPLNPRWFIHGDGGLDITRLHNERFAIHYQGWVQSRLTCDEMCPELRALMECSRDSAHPITAEIFSCYDMLPDETKAIAIPPEDNPRHLQPPDNDSATETTAPPLLPNIRWYRHISNWCRCH
jgi:hypothetical protein